MAPHSSMHPTSRLFKELKLVGRTFQELDNPLSLNHKFRICPNTGAFLTAEKRVSCTASPNRYQDDTTTSARPDFRGMDTLFPPVRGTHGVEWRWRFFHLPAFSQSGLGSCHFDRFIDFPPQMEDLLLLLLCSETRTMYNLVSIDSGYIIIRSHTYTPNGTRRRTLS